MMQEILTPIQNFISNTDVRDSIPILLLVIMIIVLFLVSKGRISANSNNGTTAKALDNLALSMTKIANDSMHELEQKFEVKVIALVEKQNECLMKQTEKTFDLYEKISNSYRGFDNRLTQFEGRIIDLVDKGEKVFKHGEKVYTKLDKKY